MLRSSNFTGLMGSARLQCHAMCFSIGGAMVAACNPIFRVLSVTCSNCKTAIEAPAEASKADAQMFRLLPKKLHADI